MMIFANSPGWMVNPPMLIQILAPLTAGKNTGATSRTSETTMEMYV